MLSCKCISVYILRWSGNQSSNLHDPDVIDNQPKMWWNERSKNKCKKKPQSYSPYRILISEMGITSMPTNISATAKDRKKKFVAFCSFFSSDTARITRIFPPTVNTMMTNMRSAGQFFSLITSLATRCVEDTVEEKLAWGSDRSRLWFRLMVVLLGQVIQALRSREAVVEPKLPSNGPPGAPMVTNDKRSSSSGHK